MKTRFTERKSLCTALIITLLATGGFSAQARNEIQTLRWKGRSRTVAWSRRVSVKFKFEGDYITPESADKLREELKFQAAVQTHLWSFPIANVMALRDGLRAVGIGNMTIPIYEEYLTPKTVVPTGNQSTIYAYNVLTLGDEPMVLNVIPDVVGTNPDAPQEYVNASKKAAHCIPPRGFAYWEMLAKALNEETVQTHDRAMMGMASFIGIEKGKPFKPDAKTRTLLIEAEKIAFAMTATLSFDSQVPIAKAYDDREWEFCFLTKSPSFDAEHRLELYERTAFTHQAMTGAFSMVLELRGKGSKYIFTSRDADGNRLNGSHSYRLNLPKNVPAKDFWSVCVYDTKTRSIIDTGRPLSAVNSYMDLPVNDDGSVDLYFGPTPPPQGEKSWVKTKPGEGFFMYLRFYGPLEPFYDKSWRPSDVVKVK